MTEEEMAEDYIKVNNLEWELECNRTSPIGEVKQAYIAGLNANKTKWHDLRKDPKDLPNGHRMVLNQVGMTTQYDPTRKCFLGLGGAGIIAWCEIPIFKDKERE